jgi:hypothetical protein
VQHLADTEIAGRSKVLFRDLFRALFNRKGLKVAGVRRAEGLIKPKSWRRAASLQSQKAADFIRAIRGRSYHAG